MLFQYKNMKSNLRELRKRMFEVVNFVNMVSQSLQGGSISKLPVNPV